MTFDERELAAAAARVSARLRGAGEATLRALNPGEQKPYEPLAAAGQGDGASSGGPVAFVPCWSDVQSQAYMVPDPEAAHRGNVDRLLGEIGSTLLRMEHLLRAIAERGS